ncbi:MAG: JAB domain-containing protein [Candidatus Brocadiia bacterium]
MTSPECAARLFEKIFGLSELAEESLCMVTLDTKHAPCGFWKVATGSINENVVHPREVFKRALLTNAHAVMLAHNHPSGDPAFSAQDRRCAGRLHKAGEMIGIPLLDFLTIGTGGSHQSAANRGIIAGCRS